MAILTGPQIRDEISWKTIEVDPYDENRVQPNSVDLTLGIGVTVYASVTKLGPTKEERHHCSSLELSEALVLHPGGLDPRKKNITYGFQMDESGWSVKPGILYLMHSAERVHSKKFVMQLNGKSSLARLGIIVHFTAAFFETGFNGQCTFEVSAMHPVRLYPGMAIAQAVYYTTYGQVEDYREKGHYVGDSAKGAVPSRSYEQFSDTGRGENLDGD